MHVELGGASVNVLRSTVGLNPVASDIASPPQVRALHLLWNSALQPRIPGEQPGTAPAAARTVLASRSCSVNGCRDVSNPAQLARQLNGILAALAGFSDSTAAR
jgi:hypothetical protein